MANTYTRMNLIPTSGLLWWHLYDSADSTDGNITDASGNARHVVQATTPPILYSDVLNGQPGWLFNGTSTNPLAVTSAVTPKHIFILASNDESTFTADRGLLSGVASGNILLGNNAATKFNDYALAGYTYRKSDTAYTTADQQAPMSGTAELLEVQSTGGIVLDGIQYGKQLATTNRWKGYFYEALAFNRVLTTTERRQVMLYFNIKFGTWAQGVPLYAPTMDLLTSTGIPGVARFRAIPPDWDAITDRWEYEDGNEDMNEVAPTAPRRWEYNLQVAESSPTTAEAYKAIFDGFNDQARRANPFYFRDKFGQVWDNVRIEDYDNSHDAHKSWAFDISFRFKTNTGVVITADSSGGAYIIDGGVG